MVALYQVENASLAVLAAAGVAAKKFRKENED